MAEPTGQLYEGLFLLSQAAAGELAAAFDHVRKVLERAQAQIVVMYKWDERRLAYPIQGQKRGLYVLALWRGSGRKITNIERDCALSEKILRVLITRGDHMGQTEIDLAIKESEKTATETKLSEEKSENSDPAVVEGEGRLAGGQGQPLPSPVTAKVVMSEPAGEQTSAATAGEAP